MNFNNNLSRGLNNLGNTCFFNSILQLLYQCTIFNKIILNDINGKLINLYRNYIIDYNNSSTNLSPNEIINYVSKKLGRSRFSQEDADQYLNYIIDVIINELDEYIKSNQLENLLITSKNIKFKTLVDSMFKIKINKEIICTNCNHISKSTDLDNKLYLTLDNNIDNLNDLIQNYKYEILDDDNKYKCEKCHKYNNAIIKKDILKLPKYLIITLKRYSNLNSKINNQIQMYEYMNIHNKDYELRGFVYHSGSTNGGHYVYYGKIRNSWYLYNDSSVEESNLDKINSGYIYLYISK
jgi:ubiquitin C-terminal hydrolase